MLRILHCNGTVDENLVREPSGSEFPNPQAILLPAQVLGRVGNGQDDYFTFEVGQAGPVSIELCADLDLSGGLVVFRDGRELGFQGVDRNCSRNTYELDEAGQWGLRVLGAGGYAMMVEAVDPWPVPWGSIEEPLQRTDGSVRLTAATESLRYVAGTPDQVRFWVSGYGFVGSVPYQPVASLDWTPLPAMQTGSYSVRAQVMQGTTPVSDVTPATLLFAVERVAVDIDIKPGNPSNDINPRSRGKIRVAILTTDTASGEVLDFDALQVDPATVRFGPDEAKAVRYRVADVDHDGDADLLLFFKTRKTGIACGDTEATLTGTTNAGLAIIGTDTIGTVGCD